MKSVREVFIENLKYYRKQKCLSQEKLSREIDMGINYINQVENKCSFPQPEIIDRIASTLSVRPAQLFDENASPANIVSNSSEAFTERVIDAVHNRLRADIKQGIDETLRKILGLK